MSKPVVYIMHPVSGNVEANLTNVVAWTKALLERDPSRVYVAPWVGEVTAYLGGFPPGGYDRVLEDDQVVVTKLDGAIAVGCGGNPWSRGMRLEGAVARDVYDLSAYRSPDEVPAEEWQKLIDSEFAHEHGPMEDDHA